MKLHPGMQYSYNIKGFGTRIKINTVPEGLVTISVVKVGSYYNIDTN
jgi:hypothetical protein